MSSHQPDRDKPQVHDEDKRHPGSAEHDASPLPRMDAATAGTTGAAEVRREKANAGLPPKTFGGEERR
jgi:hypothetical protein